MTTDLQAKLKELTAQPSTHHPYLSVYLEMVPDGSNRRLSLTMLEQELDRIAEALRGRGVNLDESFNIDRQRIMDYVNTEAPIEARGLAIFACDAESIWEAIPLQVRVPTRIVEGRYPHIFELARIIDDYETYAIVLADSQESRILVLVHNEAEQAGTTEAAEPIKRFQAGEWGQMIFQRRTDNIVKAHTKDIADRLARIIKRYDVQHVIIAGNDTIKGMVLGSLPKPIQEKLVDYINLDITGNLQSIMEVVEPMMREVELEQEAADVDQLEAQVNTKGGLGVVGASDTAEALTKGQVRVLIMHQGFQSAGMECPNCGVIRPGMRANCPFDGTPMQPVDLREGFTARAMQQNATIQIVEESEYLNQHEGVGALLWYRDDVPGNTNQDQIA